MNDHIPIAESEVGFKSTTPGKTKCLLDAGEDSIWAWLPRGSGFSEAIPEWGAWRSAPSPSIRLAFSAVCAAANVCLQARDPAEQSRCEYKLHMSHVLSTLILIQQAARMAGEANNHWRQERLDQALNQFIQISSSAVRSRLFQLLADELPDAVAAEWFMKNAILDKYKSLADNRTVDNAEDALERHRDATTAGLGQLTDPGSEPSWRSVWRRHFIPMLQSKNHPELIPLTLEFLAYLDQEACETAVLLQTQPAGGIYPEIRIKFTELGFNLDETRALVEVAREMLNAKPRSHATAVVCWLLRKFRLFDEPLDSLCSAEEWQAIGGALLNQVQTRLASTSVPSSS
jgi:hypothetical protein